MPSQPLIKKTLKNKKINNMRCLHTKKTKQSCFLLKDLKYIRNLWNKKKPHDKILLKNIISDKKKVSYNKLWDELKTKLSNTPDFDWNLIFRDHRLESITKERFVAFIPEEWRHNPTTWLTNYDIDNIMKYYTQKYSNFYYHFALGVDIERRSFGRCYYGNLCEFKLEDLERNNKDCFGVVANTVSIDASGQHWTALFISVKTKEIIFYNSAIDPPHELISKFMERIQNESKELYGKPFPIKYNTKRHQYSNTECGMFAVYFLIQMIRGISFETFVNDEDITDKNMICLRGILLNDIYGVYGVHGNNKCRVELKRRLNGKL